MTEDEEFEADEKVRIAALHKTAPETIWLQIDPEAKQFDGWDAQTWCSDQINDTDLEYVRVDVVESMRQQLAERDNQVARLREVMTQIADRLDAQQQPFSAQALREALADTDDLKGVRLCRAEPSLYFYPPTGKTLHPSRIEESRRETWKPLYRALDQK